MTAFVVTVSTGCAHGEREDRSGLIASEALADAGMSIAGRSVIPDERLAIARAVLQHCDFEPVSLLFFTGGTGPTPDDVTPQSIVGLLERRFEGIEAAIHADSRESLPTAPLSRVVVGVRGRTVIVAAPGSPNGARDVIATLKPLLRHLLSLAAGRRDLH